MSDVRKALENFLEWYRKVSDDAAGVNYLNGDSSKYKGDGWDDLDKIAAGAGQALSTLASEEAGEGWQPIEKAPIKRGFTALLYVPGLNDWQRPTELPQMMVGAWEGDERGGSWVSDYAEMEGYESTGDYIVHPAIYPTHWMPLPSTPSDQKQG